MKTVLLLCALVAGSSNLWATDTSISSFSTISGSIDSNISYATYQGDGTTAPVVSSSALRIYKPASGKSTGGYITVTAASEYKISSITITNSDDKDGTIKYSVDGGSLSSGVSIKKSASHTVSSISASSVSFYNCGSDRLSIAGFSVTYASTGGGLDAPSISPGSGAVTAGTTVTLTQASADQIRYTTNGDNPTKTTGTVYSGAITINTPTTIKAIAIKGDDVSSVASASYTISVTKPSFYVPAGKVDKGTTLTISAPGAYCILYTTDGSDPSWENSIGNIYDSPIIINSAMLVKAIAVDDYENESAITSALYNLNYAGGVNITPNYTFFGQKSAFSGSTLDVVSGTTAEGVTVTFTRNGSSIYASTTAMRVYKDNTIKIDAPAGKTITNVVFTQSAGTTDDMTSSPSGYNSITKTWTGDASSVTFSRPSKVESYLQFTNIEVVLAEKVTIGSSKYASFCSSYALDFGETNVKAYKAKYDSETNKVKLTQVDKVPANTGVVLYCATADDYTVPVIASASAVTENELVGVTEETSVVWNPSTGVYNYILQSGVFKKASEGKLRANRAYLSTSYNVAAAGARELEMVFDGEDGGVTGISNVKNQKSDVCSDIFNLAGQRVNANHKGIVIMNGKKFFNN